MEQATGGLPPLQPSLPANNPTQLPTVPVVQAQPHLGQAQPIPTQPLPQQTQRRSPPINPCPPNQQTPLPHSTNLASPGQVLQPPGTPQNAIAAHVGASMRPQGGSQTGAAPAHRQAVQPSAPTVKRRRLLDFYDFATTPDGKKVRLGGGNFATVWKGFCRVTGETVAFKIIVKSDGTGTPPAEANPMHAEILKMVDHKNIIQLKDYFDEEKALCLVLELATGGDIVEKVSSDGIFTEAAAVRYCRQILTALAHCHKRGLVHCDLKCENILFSSKQPNAELKIADFGLAQLVRRGDKLVSGRGTPEYVAPEVIERTGYDTAADMWSVGVLVYTWMSGVFPFYAPDKDENKMPVPSQRDHARSLRLVRGWFSFLRATPDPDPERGRGEQKQREILFAKIRECRYSERYIETVSGPAKHFIHCLLKRDPKERWTAEQCLQHPWIVNNTPVCLPLSHTLDNLRTQREVRETEGVSHAFYSVLLNSSSASQQTPLLVAATTVMESNELDIMGRGVAALVTMALSTADKDQQQAAGMIANYLLKREYFDRLIDGGVLLALCHLSESESIAVLNFAGLALYRIAQFRRTALAKNEQAWGRVIALGNHGSRLVARQAGRAICEMLKEESMRTPLLEMGALPITSRLVQSPMTEHQQDALAIWASLAEQRVYLKHLMADEVDIAGNLNLVVLKKDCGMGVFWLAAFILNQLTKDCLGPFGSQVVDKTLPALEILARHPQALIKNPAVAALCRLVASYSDRMAAAASPPFLALMEEAKALPQYAEELAAAKHRQAASAAAVPQTGSGADTAGAPADASAARGAPVPSRVGAKRAAEGGEAPPEKRIR